MGRMNAYLFLLCAIVAEVVGTSALNASRQFTRLGPTLLMAVCYGLAFYALSFALRVMSIGVAYAIWSGLGIVLISLAGFVIFGQKLDMAALVGLGFIIAGVVILNVFSKTISH